MIAPEADGEIIGGSQRIHDYDLLVKRLKEHSLPKSRSSGISTAALWQRASRGVGMGLERTVAWICGTEHIREVIPSPA